jgi:hypothetical protein
MLRLSGYNTTLQTTHQSASPALRALLCARLCNCHHTIRGAHDDELFWEVLAHLRRAHPAISFPEERVRDFVAARAYNVEYVAVYADSEGADEEFGPEPY